jgi:tetratricopeptide (TPR) repeat protein
VRLERSSGQVQTETLLTGSRLLILLGRLEDAERWIRQALELAPNSRDVHFELARLLLTKGNAGQAANEGETALRLSGGDVTDMQVHYFLIRAWQQSGDPKRARSHADAIRALETAVQK